MARGANEAREDDRTKARSGDMGVNWPQGGTNHTPGDRRVRKREREAAGMRKRRKRRNNGAINGARRQQGSGGRNIRTSECPMVGVWTAAGTQ